MYTSRMEFDGEIFDDNGYPTDAALDHIARFNGTPRDLIEFIDRAWWGGDYVTVEHDVESPFGYDEPQVKVRMVTVGWSGNETIIGELERTLFWMFFWYSSVRGGAYEFYIAKDRWEKSTMLGRVEHMVPPDDGGDTE